MQQQQKEQIQFLLLQYMDGRATSEQLNALTQLLSTENDDEEWQNIMEELFVSEADINNYRKEEWQPIIDSLIIKNREHSGKQAASIKRISISQSAVAACILVIISLSIYFYITNKPTQQNTIATAINDIKAPSQTKATITLANGQMVALDSIITGTLARQGNVNVTKTADGQIVYTGAASETAYNTLTNPRGSTVISLTLSDGTKVWLNSESYLKYPTAFAGNERKVEITGEAYFEVSKDAHKKFLVDAKGIITEVLGTHFNINSYSDEASTRITLLEGSVKVTNGTATGLLKPGEQAVLSQNNLQIISAETEEVMAWKNGMFQFSEENLESIMRKVSRWYNVDIEYANNDVKTLPLTGIITHFSNVSDLLRMLELTKKVRFKIDGKKIIVMR